MGELQLVNRTTTDKERPRQVHNHRTGPRTTPTGRDHIRGYIRTQLCPSIDLDISIGGVFARCGGGRSIDIEEMHPLPLEALRDGGVRSRE
jgi:hypothetical protein